MGKLKTLNTKAAEKEECIHSVIQRSLKSMLHHDIRDRVLVSRE